MDKGLFAKIISNISDDSVKNHVKMRGCGLLPIDSSLDLSIIRMSFVNYPRCFLSLDG